VGFSVPLYLWPFYAIETSASRNSTPFISTPNSNLISAVLALTSFEWLIVFFIGDTNRFGPFEILTPIIKVYKPLEVCDFSCIFFTLKTVLCGPFKMIRLLIWLIPYVVPFTCTVNFCVWICYKRAHFFLVF
jgi:hypothetical protein